MNDDRNAEALVLMQRSVEQDEAAYRIRPGHLLTARYMTIGLNNLADFGKRLGETEVALAADRRRVEMLDRRARDNPTIPAFEPELVAGIRFWCRNFSVRNRMEEAAKAADKARVRISEMNSETPFFINQVVDFRLIAHELAMARAKMEPASQAAQANVETEATATIDSIRQCILAGWRNPGFLRTAPSTEALRLAGRLEGSHGDHGRAGTSRCDDQACGRDARRKAFRSQDDSEEPRNGCRVAAAFAFRAPQSGAGAAILAQALLEAGEAEQARLAFDDALLSLQRLVQESPANEQLRADLAQSQSAAGDLFAAAGKLAEAEKIWNKALATLEDGLKANPNSIPFQTALSERLIHIAGQEGTFGLSDVAARLYRRAVEIQNPSDAINWNFIALVAAEAGDWPLVAQSPIWRCAAPKPQEMLGFSALAH